MVRHNGRRASRANASYVRQRQRVSTKTAPVGSDSRWSIPADTTPCQVVHQKSPPLMGHASSRRVGTAALDDSRDASPTRSRDVTPLLTHTHTHTHTLSLSLSLSLSVGGDFWRTTDTGAAARTRSDLCVTFDGPADGLFDGASTPTHDAAPAGIMHRCPRWGSCFRAATPQQSPFPPVFIGEIAFSGPQQREDVLRTKFEV